METVCELICHGRVRYGKGVILKTWENAQLFASSKIIAITQGIIGTLELPASKVTALTPVGSIPWFTQGIQINHLISDYSPVIVFKTFQNPDTVIEQIQETGFKCMGKESTECLQCGAEMSEFETHCSKCGWSYDG